MAVFPLFTDLVGKKCVLIGGGHVAFRKAEVLLRFDAEIIVIAPKVCQSLVLLEHEGLINVHRKAYEENDLDGAVLAVAATSSQEVNRSVYYDAVRRNIPVNTVDDPEKCTFIFPAVVKRGNLVIGVSTSGHYPALSKKLRKELEGLYSSEYEKILDMLSSYREKVRNSSLAHEQREKTLNQVVEAFFDETERSCSALERILAKALHRGEAYE